ncbi:DUF998 domain-containing protein [Streptomyces sp. R-07]|uniref:DUF998 domain-containing protein n=1 Tax=unclassified Streptomyces TaxID=2593676 RepID=UPI0034359EA7
MGGQVLLAYGVAVGPLFTVVYLLAGAMRADYKPLRHPVSSLALGRAGWVQTANFLFAGLLSLFFAVGLWRIGPSRWGAVLIGVWAVGLLGAGIFRTDPVSGYPPGTPDQLQRSTPAGGAHDLLSLIVNSGAGRPSRAGFDDRLDSRRRRRSHSSSSLSGACPWIPGPSPWPGIGG